MKMYIFFLCQNKVGFVSQIFFFFYFCLLSLLIFDIEDSFIMFNYLVLRDLQSQNIFFSIIFVIILISIT